MFKFIKRLLAVAALIVAASAPTAAYANLLAAGPGSGGSGQPVIVVSAPHPAASSSTFQWGDAGIGAAGVIALAGLGMGAALMLRRRVRHPLAS